MKEDEYFGVAPKAEDDSFPPKVEISREEQARRINEDVKTVCSSICGRRLLHHLREVFGREGTPYCPQSVNDTLYELGKFEAYKYIDNLIKIVDSNIYIKMEEECFNGDYKYDKEILSLGMSRENRRKYKEKKDKER